MMSTTSSVDNPATFLSLISIISSPTLSDPGVSKPRNAIRQNVGTNWKLSRQRNRFSSNKIILSCELEGCLQLVLIIYYANHSKLNLQQCFDSFAVCLIVDLTDEKMMSHNLTSCIHSILHIPACKASHKKAHSDIRWMKTQEKNRSRKGTIRHHCCIYITSKVLTAHIHVSDSCHSVICQVCRYVGSCNNGMEVIGLCWYNNEADCTNKLLTMNIKLNLIVRMDY